MRIRIAAIRPKKPRLTDGLDVFVTENGETRRAGFIRVTRFYYRRVRIWQDDAREATIEWAQQRGLRWPP